MITSDHVRLNVEEQNTRGINIIDKHEINRINQDLDILVNFENDLVSKFRYFYFFCIKIEKNSIIFVNKKL